MSAFLLLTPLGRLDPTVTRTFVEHGVAPSEIRVVSDYPSAATGLYARVPSSPERDRVQRAYEAAWRARVEDVTAELWVLDSPAFEAAWKLKPRLRVEWPAETVPFEARVLWLRKFHLPDPPKVAHEWAHLTRRSA